MNKTNEKLMEYYDDFAETIVREIEEKVTLPLRWIFKVKYFRNDRSKTSN